MSIRALVAAVALSAVPAFALAQEAAPAAPAAPAGQPAAATKKLAPGQPAPEFKVEKFLKGEAFSSFEKGKVYVVEFWSTWCGPCIMSMPHLSELQHEYKSKGVTITGVNVWEEQEYTEKTLTTAAEFVKGRGDAMNYTVAFDGASKHMDKNWMQASGQNGIPAAFVVDGNGIIAWIGHPMELDMVLDEVVKGTWNVETGPKKIEAANKAYEDAAAKYKDGLSAGDDAWKKATTDYPAIAKTQNVGRFMGMLEGKHTTEAYALGNKIIDDAVKAKNSMPIMGILGAFMNPQSRPENFDKSLLMKAAQANFDMAPDDYSRHAMLTQVYFSIGEIEKGKTHAAKAVEMADEKIKEPLKGWLDQAEAEAVKAAKPAETPAPTGVPK